MKLFKLLLITIPLSILSSILIGSLFFFAGTKIIPMTGPVGGSFQLGYLAGLVWLFGLGGFIGLITGVLVSLKLWKRVK